jgi:beta-glucosidase
METSGVEKIMGELNLEEKLEMIHGHGMFFIKGLQGKNIPYIYMSDATQGINIRDNIDPALVTQHEKSTAFPSPILLAATWQPGLAYKYAEAIGEECRAGGIEFLLGPGLNIYRHSQCGRNFEYFGEDPYLVSRMVEMFVKGMQSTGTAACLKHFIANNTDYYRRRSNSIVNERALHEIYLPGFKAGIEAGVKAVMTAYNQLNGEWCGQSSYVIKKLLRDELGFTGLVMTDWWSVYDIEKAIKSGLDIEMPGELLIPSEVKKLIEKEKVLKSDIDRMVENIITICCEAGFYTRAKYDKSYKDRFEHHETLAKYIAMEGTVLLKNDDNLLPIVKGDKILLTGKYAKEIPRGKGAAEVTGYNHVNLCDAMQAEFKGKVLYDKNPGDEIIKSSDVVVYTIGRIDHEANDVPFELPEEENEKIKKTVCLNQRTVVLVFAGGGIRMTDWYKQAAAIIYAWYPGQNGMESLAKILSGTMYPAGKLPITIEKEFNDSPGYGYLPAGAKLEDGYGKDVDKPVYDIHYNEGIFIGYRWYESKNIEPLYPFGHGLSYTTFRLDDFELSSKKLKGGEGLKIQVKITNTGQTRGSEVVQLYFGDIECSVERPLKELKRFEKVHLNNGESKLISFEIFQSDLAFWDEQLHDWKTEPGKFNIQLGTSSKNIVFSESFEWEN